MHGLFILFIWRGTIQLVSKLVQLVLDPVDHSDLPAPGVEAVAGLVLHSKRPPLVGPTIVLEGFKVDRQGSACHSADGEGVGKAGGPSSLNFNLLDDHHGVGKIHQDFHRHLLEVDLDPPVGLQLPDGEVRQDPADILKVDLLRCQKFSFNILRKKKCKNITKNHIICVKHEETNLKR